MILNFYCLCIFLAQFNYIFTFEIENISITPVRILIPLLFIIYLIKNQKIEINNKWIITLIFWIVYTFISIAWAKERSKTIIVGYLFFEILCLAILGKCLIKTKKDLEKLLDTMILALLVHNILCWIELKTGRYFFAVYMDRYILRGYPVSTFTNTNNLGLYLSLMEFVLIFTMILTEKKLKKLVYIILLISSLIINFKTGSRGSIISVVVGIFIFLMITIKNKKTLRIILVSTFIFVGALLFDSNFLVFITESFEKFFSIDFHAVSGTDSYRMNAYANGIDFFKNSYGMGISPGNVEYWMENYGTRYTNHAFPLHNWWLEILVTSGIIIASIVLICWISYYIKLFKNFFLLKNKKEYKIEWLLNCVMISFGVVFAIGCISPSSLYRNEWPWIFLNVFFLFDDYLKEFINKID